DNPHFSHYNMQFQNLLYTHYNGTAWSTETVDSTGLVGEFCSIDVDSNDNPHIVYIDRDNGGQLKYAAYDGNWTLSVVDEEAEYTSIVMDSTDRPHFSYYDLSDEDLRYLSQSGANAVVVSTDMSFDNSWGGIGFKLDSQGIPHIAYQNHSGNNHVSYARLNSTASASAGTEVWDIETIDTSNQNYYGSWISLDLDSQDRPHVSYFGGDNTDDLRYAYHNGTEWVTETVDSKSNTGVDRTGWYSAIVIDSTDKPQIVYSSQGTSNMRYAIHDGSDWHLDDVINSGSGAKKNIQLSLSVADVPHICYFDDGGNRLGYATYSGSGWVVDHDISSNDLTYANGDRGVYCDIEVDQFGRPHISFDYNNAEKLGYMVLNGSSWEGWQVSTMG
ncbi:MAG: hypothetical protein NZ770_06580, partial [Candidatus Poseidoniaceae archaeon]|nr:hypothetical protein [Candidatus Poseidoniaceae archaeon]